MLRLPNHGLLKMQLNKILFERIAKEAALSPRLRKAFDLRDSENENSQRMLNVLQPGTKTPIHRHQNSSEIVICIYGSAIERFYDQYGNEVETVKMAAGSDTPGVVVEIGRYHSLEATDQLGVVFSAKAGSYEKIKAEDILNTSIINIK